MNGEPVRAPFARSNFHRLDRRTLLKQGSMLGGAALLAKPLLILVLAGAVAAITRTGRPNWHELALIALPVVLLGAAKPNYLGSVVQVVLAMAAWNRAAKRDVSWTRVASICVPAVLTLGASYALYRSLQPGSEGGVIVAPLRVLALYVPVDPRSIAGHVGASVAFPLAVLALWPRAAWNTPEIRFAWGATLVALLISFMLAENGPSLDHGNFLWTGQMAVFVLFVVSAMFVNHQLLPAARSGWTATRALLTAGVLVLHVESGVRHVMTRVDSVQWLAFWMGLGGGVRRDHNARGSRRYRRYSNTIGSTDTSTMPMATSEKFSLTTGTLPNR